MATRIAPEAEVMLSSRREFDDWILTIEWRGVVGRWSESVLPWDSDAGFAISNRIAALHGGRVFVEDATRQTLAIALPVHAPQAPEVAAPSTVEAQAARSGGPEDE